MKVQPSSVIAQWVSGRVAGTSEDVQIGPDVVIDSRLATPGSLFVAIPGERVDGHDFAARAGELGAAAVLATRDTGAPLPHIVVDDTVAGLSALARGVVSDAATRGLTVCAITGSSGKTSTKDILAQLLAAAGPTIAPLGSFNNEIGLPLTACGVGDDTRFLVSEMGSRGKGHVAWLCSITPPHVSIVLNVGTAHLGEFGSQAAIAEAKGEIVEALPADGWAVLNADDPLVAAMASRTSAHIAWFSADGGQVPDDAELVVTADHAVADELDRYSFVLSWRMRGVGGVADGQANVRLPLMGRHLVIDAIAAFAAAIAAGVDPTVALQALASVEPRSRWRMELTERPDGVVVINDAYNANPDSMAAALDTLARVLAARRRSSPTAQAIAVLGDMLELGDDSVRFHEEVGRRVVQAGVTRLIAVGEFAAAMAKVAADGGVQTALAPDAAAAADLVRPQPGDTVLIKASRGIALERVASAIVNEVSE